MRHLVQAVMEGARITNILPAWVVGLMKDKSGSCPAGEETQKNSPTMKLPFHIWEFDIESKEERRLAGAL